MKTLADRIAERYPNHEHMEWDVFNGVVEIAKQYCTEAIKEHLSRAAENARTRTNDESTSIIVDRESITNIDITLP